MASVYLLCGKTGSGKTTFARHLEAERRAFRLSLDELMLPLFGAELPRPEFEQRLATCKELLLGLCERLVAFGGDVVLDWGFWARQERIAVRARLSAARARVHLLYFALPDELLLARLRARNQQLPPGTYAISDELFERLSSRFEPPGADEAHETLPTHLSGSPRL